jgi:predicted metal-dependent phosphoesterase TrpH
MIDLHMHTVFSDGASEPEALVKAGAAYGLTAMAITDHDNTECQERALKAAEEAGIELIPGIEINTHWDGREIHILGYFIDMESELLQDVIARHKQARIAQVRKMVERINVASRMNLKFEDILARAHSDGCLGRPHVAQAIVEKRGAASISDAFGKYLNPAAATYIRRETVTPHEAVEAIHESGGLAVIAHPGEMVGIEALAEDLMNYGLAGLEAYHRSHSPAIIELHCTLAEKLGLMVTGGTDFHGQTEFYPNALARLHMPPYILQKMKERLKRRQHSRFTVK